MSLENRVQERALSNPNLPEFCKFELGEFFIYKYTLFAEIFANLDRLLPEDIKSIVTEWVKRNVTIPIEKKNAINIPISLIGEIKSDIPQVRGLIMLRDVLKMANLLIYILETDNQALLNQPIKITDTEIELLGCGSNVNFNQEINLRTLIYRTCLKSSTLLIS